MPRLTPSDVHTNTVLTNVGFRFINQDYIGAQVFPTVAVKNKTDAYYYWNKEQFFRDEAKMVAPGDPAPRVGLSVSSTTYTAETYKIAHALPRETRDNADSQLKLQARITEYLTDKIMLAREVRVAAAVNTSGNWTNSTTLTGTDRWTDKTNSTPVANIDTAMIAVRAACGGLRPNIFAMGPTVWDALKRHPAIVRGIHGEGSVGSTIVTEDLVAKFFGIDKCLVGYGREATSLEAATVVMDDIWSTFFWCGHVTKSASPITPTAGYNMQQFYRVRSWYDDNTDTDFIEASESADEKVIAADCGYLITTAVA